MKVYIIKNEWYESQQGDGYPNTGQDIKTIKMDKTEAIDTFNELKKRDKQNSGSYSKTLICEAKIDEDKEFEETDITDIVNQEKRTPISIKIDLIKKQQRQKEEEKEIYIIKREWFSDDQGGFPNADVSIIDISFDKEKVRKIFNESVQKDEHWNGGFIRTLISKANIGKNTNFKEEDITEKLKQELYKNNSLQRTANETEKKVIEEELNSKMEESKDLDKEIGQAEELLSEFEKQDPDKNKEGQTQGDE